MSKEMAVIVLGVWIMVLTQLGVPYHPWGVILFVVTGIGIAIIGFLLRGEALSRGTTRTRATFVEHVAEPIQPTELHDHQEGVTSLN